MFKKISLIFLAAVCFGSVVFAQSSSNNSDSTTSKKTRTLWGALSPNVKSVGIYIAPELQYISAAGAYAPAAGLSGMILLNQKLALGVAASHSRGFIPSDLNNDGLRMNYGFGAAQVEYTIAPQSLLHLSIPLSVGAGMARIDSVRSSRRFDAGNHQPDHFGPRPNRNEPFFVIQPGLKLEANLTRFAKCYIGANYRLVAGDSYVKYPVGAAFETLSTSKLSGFNFSAGIKLGWFDYSLKKRTRS
jgi:hypothetical protein